MPVIRRKDGTVIAWSGIKAGPIPEYEPMGSELWVRYEAEVGDARPEAAKIAVRVEKAWRNASPAVAVTRVEELEKRVVESFIEEYVIDVRKKPLETGATNNFSLSSEEMLRRSKLVNLRPSSIEIGNHGETIPTGEGFMSAVLFNPARADITLKFHGSALDHLKQTLSAGKGGITLPASYLNNSRVYRALIEWLIGKGWDPSKERNREVSDTEFDHFVRESR